MDNIEKKRGRMAELAAGLEDLAHRARKSHDLARAAGAERLPRVEDALPGKLAASMTGNTGDYELGLVERERLQRMLAT